MTLVKHLTSIMKQCDEYAPNTGINIFPHIYLYLQETAFMDHAPYQKSTLDDLTEIEGGYYRSILPYCFGRRGDSYLSFGFTTLHLKHNEAKRNIYATMLVHADVNRYDEMVDGVVRPMTVHSVLLLETGVISAMYLMTDEGKASITTFYPEGMEGFAATQYPESDAVMEAALYNDYLKLKCYRSDFENLFPLVKMAMKAHHEVSEETPPVINLK